MKVGAWSIGITMVLLVTSMSGVASDAPSGPDSVTATTIGYEVALVSWTPVPSADVDSYLVYGASSSEGLVLLLSTLGSAAVVDGGYSTYAVSAVVNGVETELTFAEPLPCVDVEPENFPPVVVETNCGSAGLHLPVKVLPP